MFVCRVPKKMLNRIAGIRIVFHDLANGIYRAPVAAKRLNPFRDESIAMECYCVENICSEYLRKRGISGRRPVEKLKRV